MCNDGSITPLQMARWSHSRGKIRGAAIPLRGRYFEGGWCGSVGLCVEERHLTSSWLWRNIVEDSCNGVTDSNWGGRRRRSQRKRNVQKSSKANQKQIKIQKQTKSEVKRKKKKKEVERRERSGAIGVEGSPAGYATPQLGDIFLPL